MQKVELYRMDYGNLVAKEVIGAGSMPFAAHCYDPVTGLSKMAMLRSSG